MYKYKNHPQNIKIVVFNEKHFRIWHHPIKTPRKEKTVAEGHGYSQARMRITLTIHSCETPPFVPISLHFPPALI